MKEYHNKCEAARRLGASSAPNGFVLLLLDASSSMNGVEETFASRSGSVICHFEFFHQTPDPRCKRRARAHSLATHLSIIHSFIYYITQYPTHLLWCFKEISSLVVSITCGQSGDRQRLQWSNWRRDKIKTTTPIVRFTAQRVHCAVAVLVFCVQPEINS